MGIWDDIKGGASKAWNGFTGNPLDPGGFMDKPKIDPTLATWTDRDYLSEQYKQGAAAAPMQAPQTGSTQLGQIHLGQGAQLDPSQQAQARAMSMQQAQRLGAIASGQQQGAGELAAQRQAMQAAAQQQAAARMNRGMSAASAQRGAARNMANIGVGAAGQAQQAALSDQAAAGQQLGGMLDQMRGQDIGLAGQNAQLAQQHMLQQGQMDQQTSLQQGQMDQQAALANADRQLQMQGLNAQQRMQYLQGLANMNQSEVAGRTGAQQVAMQGDMRGPMLQAGAGILAAMSDERVKHDVSDGGADVDEMLDALRPKSYRYKDSAPKQFTGIGGDGRKLAGIMAQSLERSKAGKAIVRDTEQGKVIDMVGGMSATLAGLARLNARLRELEKKG